VTGPRRWWYRAAGGVLAFAATEVAVRAIHGTVDDLRLALVVALVVSAAGLLVDSSYVEPAAWAGTTDPEAGLARLDPRTAALLRVLESHQTAREPDGALAGRLRDLADRTLRARHDVGLDDPRGAALLGPELVQVLTGPPRRLRVEEVERCVERIEEL
jgi:hypothetical protein